MDRPAQGHEQSVEFLGFKLSPGDLQTIKELATRHYIDHGNPNMTRSIVQALSDFLSRKCVTLIQSDKKNL
jgi:hypothetical protein